MSVWRDRARTLIYKLVADLPETATVAERRKALWGKGWAAHQGTSWGRKMWGREVREYLARHGDSLGAARLPQHEWPADIAFPFRSEVAADRTQP